VQRAAIDGVTKSQVPGSLANALRRCPCLVKTGPRRSRYLPARPVTATMISSCASCKNLCRHDVGKKEKYSPLGNSDAATRELHEARCNAYPAAVSFTRNALREQIVLRRCFLKVAQKGLSRWPWHGSCVPDAADFVKKLRTYRK